MDAMSSAKKHWSPAWKPERIARCVPRPHMHSTADWGVRDRHLLGSGGSFLPVLAIPCSFVSRLFEPIAITIAHVIALLTL